MSIDATKKSLNDRLTTKQVSLEFNIPYGTISYWRYCRKSAISKAEQDKYPRYHKLVTGKVYYLRSEFEADMERMEVDVDTIGMTF